jgi:hypothetical protein
MALPVPTVAQLASFTGREVESYTAYASAALAQATLLLELVTGLNDLPDDENLSKLAVNAILEMADRLTYDQVYQQVNASPFQAETIGSYSYSKGSHFAERARSGQKLGLMWWDLALEMLSGADRANTASGSITVFEPEVSTGVDGSRSILNPAEVDEQGGAGFVNASQFRF